MPTTASIPNVNTRRASDHINERPSKNLHHALRLAKSIKLPINRLVTINFSHTSLPPEQTSRAFKRIRASFGKWARHPKRDAALENVPPTYVWVIENPGGNGHLHVHWAIHIPAARVKELEKKLAKWVSKAADVCSNKVIHIEPVTSILGLERYMLKGLHKPLARKFHVDYFYQGFVTDKRIGHSKNLGPVQFALMCELQVHPRPRPWRQNKYDNPKKASA